MERPENDPLGDVVRLWDLEEKAELIRDRIEALSDRLQDHDVWSVQFCCPPGYGKDEGVGEDGGWVNGLGRLLTALNDIKNILDLAPETVLADDTVAPSDDADLGPL